MQNTFTLDRRSVGSVTILYLEGPLRLGYCDAATGHQLSDAVRQLLSSGTTCIVLDLRGLLKTPDSSGLGELVAMEAALRGAGGGLALVNVPQKLREVISIMRLESLFKIADTEDEAVALLRAE